MIGAIVIAKGEKLKDRSSKSEVSNEHK